MSRELRRHQLSVRIPKRLYEALEKEAEADRRSIADIVNIMLEDRYVQAANGKRRRR